MRKKLLCLFVILILVMSMAPPALADEDSFDDYGDKFTTSRYDVDVVADENCVFHITETIDVDFHVSQHGIFRYIPKDFLNYRIENLQAVGDPYEVERGGEMILKIGDPLEEIEGRHTYQLTYDLVCYGDSSTEKDELLLDLLPTGWETAIETAEIRMTFPKKIDEDSISVYSGFYGTEENELSISPNFYENGTVMTISAEDLSKGEGITVAADLPEGYWVEPESGDWMVLPIAAMLILVPFILFLLWLLFGRDQKMVKTVEFYPPDEMTPVEIGYVVDGTVDHAEVSSMLVYFAEKGYLQIHEYEQDQYELIKLRPMEDNEKAFCKTIFDGYFSKSEVVKLSKLPKSLKKCYESAAKQIEAYYKEERKVYTTKSRVSRYCGIILFLMMTIVPSSLAVVEMYPISIMGPILLYGVTACMGLGFIISSFDHRYSFLAKTKRDGFFRGGVFLLLNAVANGWMIIYVTGNIIMAALAVLSIFMCVVFICLMNAKTKTSTELMGRILGFRGFIKSAELEKLKLMVEENPSYFYDIMPYASVFGLSDKWIKRFKKLPMTEPRWYVGSTPWNYKRYRRMTRTIDSKIHKAIRQGSDRRGSGGRSSGGGHGGGGGGSW